MSPASPPPRQRRTARVILLSPANEVFLIRFAVSRAGAEFAFWATPGGEIDEGEAQLAAAQRELYEELGLTLELDGPVHATTAEFELDGAPVVGTDVFFVARCARDAPCLQPFTEVERAAMRGARWWALPDLDATHEHIFPDGLSALVRKHVGE